MSKQLITINHLPFTNNQAENRIVPHQIGMSSTKKTSAGTVLVLDNLVLGTKNPIFGIKTRILNIFILFTP